MSALQSGVPDRSVEAARRFALECEQFQLYVASTVLFEGGVQRKGLTAVSGLQVIVAIGPGWKGPNPLCQ